MNRYSLYLLLATFACAPLAADQSTKPDLASPGLRASVTEQSLPRESAKQLTPEMRGDIYMARKMYREAIDMYRKTPETAVTANKIGLAFHQLSYLNLARKNYAEAVKLDPVYAEAINNLGTVYYTERSYKKSIVYYKRSLKYSGPIASVYVNLGTSYFARRNYKKASEYYEEAMRLDPDVMERRDTFGTRMQEHTVEELALFHLYLAKAYAKRGADERALLYLRKALEEGLADRKKLPDMPEFSLLKNQPAFQELLAENPKAL